MTRALILIDIQMGFDNPIWGTRNNPAAETNAANLLAHWRSQHAPIVHVKHISTTPGSPLAGAGTDFKPQTMPDGNEPVFEKSVNSAFIGTGLEQHLQALGVTDLVICGLTTPHCVSTTCRMGANLGFDVVLAHDACASFAGNADTSWANLPPLTAQEIHDTAISHLHGEFVTALSTDAIVKAPS